VGPKSKYLILIFKLFLMWLFWNFQTLIIFSPPLKKAGGLYFSKLGTYEQPYSHKPLCAVTVSQQITICPKTALQ